MAFFKKIFKGNTLYYPGCLTKFALKDVQEKYKKILKNEGIEFIMLKNEEICCGSPVKNAGEDEVFNEVAEKNLQIFKNHSISRIITNCPSCAYVFKEDYKKVLGDKWDIEVEHILEVINKSKSNSKDIKKEKVTYHDPCHLGRSLGIYERPRTIIQNQGFEIEEMDLNHNESYCCGGGGGIKTNEPKLSNRVAKDRIKQAEKTKAKILLTSCPMCYLNLKDNSEGIEVQEISSIIE